MNVQAPTSMVAATPYFTNNSDAGKVKEPLLARIRIRFRDITGQLAERFGSMLSGQFSAGSNLKDKRQQRESLQAQRKQTRQERQNREYYRKNGVVVDISAAPPEHLMDSYGKSGEYSKLTTEQKR